MKLRVGLVGTGRHWESRHRAALRSLPDRLEVRAVCTPVAHHAEQVAHEFGAVAVDGFRSLARREDVDALLLLASDWYGALPIFAACEAGKAVYCAAPLEVDPTKARELKERVEEAGIAFFAEFPCRPAPATLRLKELIATQLGPPRMLFCHQRQAAVRRENGKPPTSTRRALMEMVDWCRYVVGREPTAVTGMAHGGMEENSSEDYQMMSLDFSPRNCPGREAVAQISCGRYLPAEWHEAITFRPPAGMQVACERGVAFVDLPTTLIWFDSAGRHMESLESERPVGEQLLLDFYRSVTSLVRSKTSLEDAYRALQIVLLAGRSHAEGKRLDL